MIWLCVIQHENFAKLALNHAMAARHPLIKPFFLFNNFILRWYCTIAEANKNQSLITINMALFIHDTTNRLAY